MNRCYLVRHAQTAWNGEHRIQGHSDLPLSALGRQQAERLAAFFAGRRLKGIFTSSLQRSRETAQAIAAGGGCALAPIVTPALAEIHLGAWEGLTPEEVNARFGGAYQQWCERPSSVAIPRAEPLGAFQARVREAFGGILTRLDGEGEYVIVSHGGVIAAVLADLLGADYDAVLRRVRLDNAGITALEAGARSPSVMWVNWTGHLDGTLPVPLRGGWF